MAILWPCSFLILTRLGMRGIYLACVPPFMLFDFRGSWMDDTYTCNSSNGQYLGVWKEDSQLQRTRENDLPIYRHSFHASTLVLMVILLSECGTKNPSILWEQSIRLDLQFACDIRVWKPRALWNLLSISHTYNIDQGDIKATASSKPQCDSSTPLSWMQHISLLGAAVAQNVGEPCSADQAGGTLSIVVFIACSTVYQRYVSRATFKNVERFVYLYTHRRRRVRQHPESWQMAMRTASFAMGRSLCYLPPVKATMGVKSKVQRTLSALNHC